MIVGRLLSLLFYFFAGFVSIVGSGGLIYYLILFMLVVGFVFLRFPLLFGVIGYVYFLVSVIGLLFMAIVVYRCFSNWRDFFLQFLPEGTPVWIAPLICALEVISFCVRPVVLMLRPLVNFSLGLVVMHLIVYNSFSSFYPMMAVWIFWFLYEVFVCIVQSYIVFLILSFTKDL